MDNVRKRPKPEKVFYDELVRLIKNQLINDPNFQRQGWGLSWYEKNNKIDYKLFCEKAEYILDRIEEMKHLILEED